MVQSMFMHPITDGRGEPCMRLPTTQLVHSSRAYLCPIHVFLILLSYKHHTVLMIIGKGVFIIIVQQHSVCKREQSWFVDASKTGSVYRLLLNCRGNVWLLRKQNSQESRIVYGCK